MNALRHAIAILILVLPETVTAQISIDWPLIGLGDGQGVTDCSDAPAACQGEVCSEPGTIEVFIYPSGNGGQVSSCAFALDYPNDWSIVTAEVCAGIVTEGSVYLPRDGFRMQFAPCINGLNPALRLVFIALSAGRMTSVAGNTTFGYTSCPNGIFHSYGVRGGYIDVGNVCGGYPLRNPCDFCSLTGSHAPMAVVAPSALEITVGQGQVGTANIHVTTGLQCQQLPECTNLPTLCNGELQSNTSWLQFVTLGQGNFEARIDASSLIPGTYDGSAEAEGYGCCNSVCWPVLLTVVPSTTGIGEPEPVPVSWGRLKSHYR